MTKQQDHPEGSTRKSKPVYSIPERNYSPSAFGGFGDGGEENLNLGLVCEAPESSSEKSGGLFSRATSWFKDKLTGAADIASDVVTPIQEGFAEAGEVVNERVVDPAQNTISDRLVDPAKSVLRERVIEPISQGFDAVTRTASGAVDVANDIATPIQEGFAEAGDNFNERIVDPVENDVSERVFNPAKSILRDQVIEPIIGGIDATARAAAGVADIVNDVVTPIQEGFAEAGDVVNERIFDSLRDEVTERVVESLTRFTEGGDALAVDQIQEVLEAPEITSDVALEAADTLTAQPIPRSIRSVESGTTLWQIAQEELGDGNRWSELQKADGSTFSIEESRRLQIGSEVYISGTQEADANINIAGNDVEVEHPVLESEGLEESTTLEEPSFIEQSELSAISSGSDFYRNAGTNPFAASYQGQCTWFSYGRMLETDLLPDNTQTARAFLGNAGTWEADAHRLGLPVLDKPEPEKSYLMVFPPKVRGAGEVGHVAFLEEVFSNGDIRISESNWNGQEIAERTIKAGNYSGIKFVELAEK
jgi:surface antigen